MKQFILYLTLLMTCIVNFNVFSQESTETIERLKTTLASSKTTNDSVKIMLDIFDAMPHKERPQVGKEIYEIAKRTKNTDLQIEILRLISVCFDDAETLSLIEEEAKKLPTSEMQKESALFIKMRKISARARKLSEKDRQKEIVRILHEFENKGNNDKLRQMLDLYTLVEFMRNNASGDMLKEYIERLSNLADSPDIVLPSIKNIIYSEAASIYSDAGDHEKALKANRKALEVIEQLEKSYRDKGRSYRNYDNSRYVIYRRMLRNYEVLRPGESEKYYNMAMALAAKNSEIRQNIENNPRIKAYYYMSIGDYNSALPELKEAVKKFNNIPRHKQLLEMLILASEKTGDDKTRIEALEKYNSILYELIELNAAEKSRELQIKYDLQDLKDRNDDLERENKEQEIESERNIMTFVTVAFILLLIAFVIMLYYWGRYRKNTSKMGLMVDNIHRERYRLRNSLYADYADEFDPLKQDEEFEQYRWEKRLRKAKESRGDATIFMTESIISDLLFIAATGHANLKKHITNTSVDSILRRAESRAIERNGDNTKIRVKFPENDFKIVTDSDCMVALLGHTFDVARKNYPDSIMKLESREASDKFVDFVITIEGEASASANDPQIFHDMAITDIMLNYQNSGLYVCRMIAFLMQCELIADPNYREGTRYFFRIPSKLEI